MQHDDLLTNQILHLWGCLHVSCVRHVLCAVRTIFYPYSTNQIVPEVVVVITVVIYQVQSALRPINLETAFSLWKRNKRFQPAVKRNADGRPNVWIRSVFIFIRTEKCCLLMIPVRNPRKWQRGFPPWRLNSNTPSLLLTLHPRAAHCFFRYFSNHPFVALMSANAPS